MVDSKKGLSLWQVSELARAKIEAWQGCESGLALTESGCLFFPLHAPNSGLSNDASLGMGERFPPLPYHTLLTAPGDIYHSDSNSIQYMWRDRTPGSTA